MTKNFKIIFQEYKIAINELIKLSLPIIAGNLGGILIGATDVLVASKYSIDTLNAISIANAIVFCIMIIGTGLMSSISIVLSNYRGNRKPVKKFLISSIVFSIALALILGSSTLSIIPLIDKVGFNQHIVYYIKEYIYISSFSYLGLYLYQSLKEFLQAYEIVFFPNIILLIAVFLNLIFDVVFVFGFGLIQPMGVKGLAIATLMSRSFMGFCLFLYCLKLIKNKTLFDKDYIKELIKVGYPISFSLLFEFLGFNVITILMGRENPIFASIHNIITLVISTGFMIPLSLSNVIALKVGFFNGANSFQGIKKYSIAGILLSTSFMLGMSFILIFFPHNILSIFIKDSNILNLAVPILFIAAFFEIFDGLQVSLNGVLKGIKMTKAVSLCTIIGYWLIGIPLGAILAYKFNMMLKGFWIGLAISFLAISFIQISIVYFKFKSLKSKMNYQIPKMT